MSNVEIFSVKSSALPASARLHAFSGREAISRPFSFDLQVHVAHDDSAQVDMEHAILQPISFVLHTEDGAARASYHGVIAAIELLSEPPDDDAIYRLTMVPKFWQLGLSRHSRVWVDKALPDILEEVFHAGGLAGADYELRLSGNYDPIEFVCQYRESHLDFVSRWMERTGIYYFFDHSGEHEKLILTDDKGSQEKSRDSALGFFAGGAGDGSTVESMRRFAGELRAVPKGVKIKDYEAYPRQEVTAQSSASSHGVAEVVRYGMDNARKDALARRLADVHAQRILGTELVYRGSGRAFGLRPGYTFSLTGHPRTDYDREYLLTEVIHRGQLAAQGERDRVGGTGDEVYSVDVTAIDAEKQYRPELLTPVPTVHGYVTGTVDGEADSDYSQLDTHGSYLVRFHFDESGLPPAKASARVRMLQPHAGEPESWHFPLRKNTEVLLGFLGGDPDRPVIAGAVPNAFNPSLVTASNHTQNVIQTGGRTRIEIEDNDGGQYCTVSTPTQSTFIHMGTAANGCQHNFAASTDGNGLHHSGTDTDIDVDGHKTEDVIGDVLEIYSLTQDTEVTGTVTEEYHSNMTTKVAVMCSEDYGSHKTTTSGHVIEECLMQMTTVSASVEEKHGSQTTTVSSVFIETVGGAHTLNVSGSMQTTVGGVMMVNSMGTTSIKAPTLTLKAPLILFMNLGAYTETATTKIITYPVKLILGPLSMEYGSAKISTNTGADISLTATSAEVDVDYRTVCSAGMEFVSTLTTRGILSISTVAVLLENKELHAKNAPIIKK